MRQRMNARPLVVLSACAVTTLRRSPTLLLRAIEMESLANACYPCRAPPGSRVSLHFFAALSSALLSQPTRRRCTAATTPIPRCMATPSSSPSEGDLWSVGIHGGQARRLTTGAGTENKAPFRRTERPWPFAPTTRDPSEVYTIPIEGGLPQRRTWDGELRAGRAGRRTGG